MTAPSIRMKKGTWKWNASKPLIFELFEDYIAEEDSQLAADGVELEARTAWMHEMYRAMLNTLKE